MLAGMELLSQQPLRGTPGAELANQKSDNHAGDIQDNPGPRGNQQEAVNQ